MHAFLLPDFSTIYPCIQALPQLCFSKFSTYIAGTPPVCWKLPLFCIDPLLQQSTTCGTLWKSETLGISLYVACDGGFLDTVVLDARKNSYTGFCISFEVASFGIDLWPLLIPAVISGYNFPLLLQNPRAIRKSEFAHGA